MDRIDRNILRHLQTDGRLTNQELAERVSLSPSPCLRRVRNLERSGVIRGYTAIVDRRKYGLAITAFVNVRLEKQNDQTVRNFEKGIAELDEVLACYLISGARDYLMHVVCEDLGGYERFIRDKLTRVPGIGELESNFVFGEVKSSPVLPPVRGQADP